MNTTHLQGVEYTTTHTKRPRIYLLQSNIGGFLFPGMHFVIARSLNGEKKKIPASHFLVCFRISQVERDRLYIRTYIECMCCSMMKQRSESQRLSYIIIHRDDIFVHIWLHEHRCVCFLLFKWFKSNIWNMFQSMAAFCIDPHTHTHTHTLLFDWRRLTLKAEVEVVTMTSSVSFSTLSSTCWGFWQSPSLFFESPSLFLTVAILVFWVAILVFDMRHLGFWPSPSCFLTVAILLFQTN